YSSIKHADMGGNVESEARYRQGDGYYAFVQNGTASNPLADNSAAPAPSTPQAQLSLSAKMLDKPPAAIAARDFTQDKAAMENAAQQAQIAAAQAQAAADSTTADAADRAAIAGDAAKRAAQTVADKAYALQQAAWQAAQDAERKAEEARALLETANKAKDAAEQAAHTALIKAQDSKAQAAAQAVQQEQTGNIGATVQATQEQVAQLPPPAMPALSPTITDRLPVSDIPASFAALVNAGRDEFRQQAYHAARDTFEQATQKQPMNQDAHFWLAMAYWHLYDYENAKDQLELTFRLNPFDTEGQVAKSRLPDIAAFLDKQGRPAVDSASQLQQTMRDVSRQAGSLQAQQYLNGEQTAASRINIAAIESDKIRRQTGQYLASARADADYYGYEPANLDEVSDLGYINAHYQITDGFVQATAARADAANRMTNVSDWQNYLLSSLGDQPHPGQPRLRAFGTNLYVQYYGDEGADSAPPTASTDPELKAIALRYQPPSGTMKATLLRQAYQNLKNSPAK
ncbi:MAG TPA: hypothetical protein V6D22_21615, partial [Candidatus Obscuribacterales bacterium]